MQIGGVLGSGVPAGGISSSGAARHQADFDQLKQQVQEATVQHTHELHQFTAEAWKSIPPPKTEAGPGHEPMWILTPQTMNEMIRADEASGYAGVSLGSAFPPNTYQGHMLNRYFHMLDPVFRGLVADFHS